MFCYCCESVWIMACMWRVHRFLEEIFYICARNPSELHKGGKGRGKFKFRKYAPRVKLINEFPHPRRLLGINALSEEVVKFLILNHSYSDIIRKSPRATRRGAGNNNFKVSTTRNKPQSYRKFRLNYRH